MKFRTGHDQAETLRAMSNEFEVKKQFKPKVGRQSG
jgi:hypothetical protein